MNGPTVEGNENGNLTLILILKRRRYGDIERHE